MDKSDLVSQKPDLSKNPGTNLTKTVKYLLIEAKDKTNRGLFKDSLEILNYCVTLTPDFDEVYLALADLYLKKGQYQEGLDTLNRAIDLAPDNPKIYILRGEIFRLLKQPQASLKDLNRAIKLDGNNPIALGQRGTLFRKVKEFAKSLQDYNQAIALDPTNSWLYGNRAETYRELKEYQKAVSDYNKVLMLNPELNWVYERRGYPYLWLDELDLARSDFERGWHLNNANLMAGWMSVWAAMCQTPFPFTPEIKERLIQLVGQSKQGYMAYLCRAILHWIEGDLNAGYKELKIACDLLPHEPAAYFWQGIFAASLGKDNEALDLFGKALELGLPPVLLSPIRWLDPVNPRFYQMSGQALLPKAFQEKSPSYEDTVKTQQIDRVKNSQSTTNDLKPQLPVQTSPLDLSFDATSPGLKAVPIENSKVTEYPAEPSFDSTAKLLKPFEPSPVKPSPELAVEENDEPEPDELTQRFKVIPYNKKVIEPAVNPLKIGTAGLPSKPQEATPVESPLRPDKEKAVDRLESPQEPRPLDTQIPVQEIAPEKPEAARARAVEKPFVFPEPKLNPPAEVVKKLDDQNTLVNFSNLSRQTPAPKLREKIPEAIPIPLSTQAAPFGIKPENNPVFAETSHKQAGAEIKPPPFVSNHDALSVKKSPAKKSRVLFLPVIVFISLIILGLLVFIFWFNRNDSQPASNRQAAISNTPASEITNATVTASASSQAVPTTPTPLKTTLSGSEAPVSTSVTQPNPTTVLAIFATPIPTNPTTDSQTKTAGALTSTTPGTSQAASTPAPQPTSNPATSPPATTIQPSYSLLNTTPLNGHTGMITTASWTKDGRYFLTASEDKTIKVWDAGTKQVVRTLDDKTRPNTQAVLTARWSDDGQYIISGAADKFVRLYIVFPKQNISKLAAGSVLVEATDKVTPQAVAMAPDNSLVLYPGPNVVHSWNTSTDDQGPDFLLNSAGADVTALTFTSDSKYLSIGLSNGLVELWDIKAHKLILTLPAVQAPAEPVTFLEWLPGQNHLAVGYRQSLSVYAINLNGVASAFSISALPLKIKINTLVLSPDGKRLAVGSPTGQVELWSFDDKKLISQFSVSAQEPAPVVGLHWDQNSQEVSVISGGAKPFLAVYRIPAN